jgi:hypothetical protein
VDVQAAVPMIEAGGREGAGAQPGTLARVLSGVGAAVLLILAIRLPVWEARLSAPQYPQGLTLSAYGDRVEGDVGEITALNHYVGMRPYDPDDLPEMKLWVPTLVAAVAAATAATVLGRGIWGRLARLFVWSIPFGVLAVIQFRLYHYGHDLATDPRPAIDLEPFTPWVVGKTHVINFTTLAFPGAALLAILAAAAILSFGPGLPETTRRLVRWMRTPVAAAVAKDT